jgi:undecaprenyl diphosphate synthase
MKIEKKIKPENLHVAIVMDGNGRWANERALARLKGHAKGADRVRHIVRASLDMNVTHLTLFAFSTENWKRSESEVVGLMSLFKKFMKSEAKKLLINGVRVRFIGDRSRLDKSLIMLMGELELLTIENDNLNLTIALNYGGRDEIVRATKKISEKVKLGVLNIDDITVEMISNNLDTFGLPDPDLVIRTSGEVRTSNFLPWQCAYSEYVFEKTNWPDFNNEIYEEILIEFKKRERRFGAILK